jgi:hypothetical protein
MHRYEEQAIRDYTAIPVVDYVPYFAGEAGALERLAGEVAYACVDWVFYGWLYNCSSRSCFTSARPALRM